MLSCLWDGSYKESLLIIRKNSPCGGSRFPLLLSEWFFTISQTENDLSYFVCMIKNINTKVKFPFKMLIPYFAMGHFCNS